MLEQSVIYPPRDGYPFYITAKRYWISGQPMFDPNGPDTMTLLLLHGTGFHKETWEPSLERIFDLTLHGDGILKIREAWAIDCPNHGASAQLNESALQQPALRHNCEVHLSISPNAPFMLLVVTCEKYATAVHHFLLAGRDHGAKVDFRQRNLVGVAHSLGGVSMLAKLYVQLIIDWQYSRAILQNLEPKIKFSSVILVEPLLSPGGKEHVYSLRKRLVRSAYERRDVWPSREDAFQSLKMKTSWHPRVIELFVVKISTKSARWDCLSCKSNRNMHLGSTLPHTQTRRILD